MAKISKAQSKKRLYEASKKLQMAMSCNCLSSIQRKHLFDTMNKCLDMQKYFN